jgi:MSHA biogenesis protein MshJ
VNVTLPTLRRPALRRPDLTRALARWHQLGERLQARAPRERVMIGTGCVLVALLLVDALWISPAWARWQVARAARDEARQALASLDQADQALRRRREEEIVRLRAEIDALRRRVAEAEARGDARDLVTPQRMLPVLEQLLARQPGLQVRALQSLPPVAADDRRPALWRHGVELTVEGRYPDLLGHLRQLEALPERVLWSGLQLAVTEHPTVRLTLRLHTLGAQTGWVGL